MPYENVVLENASDAKVAGVVPSTRTYFKLAVVLLKSKEFSSIFVTPLPMLTDVRFGHSTNAHLPIVVTELGMVIAVRSTQC